MNHFCTCPVTRCPRHPLNHDKGCDLCIKDNILKKKMPACMFVSVNKDVSSVTDYSIKGFVEFYEKCNLENTNETTDRIKS